MLLNSIWSKEAEIIGNIVCNVAYRLGLVSTTEKLGYAKLAVLIL